MAALGAVAYVTGALAGLATVVRLWMPRPQSLSDHYLTLITACWSIAVVVWAPPTGVLLHHLTGRRDVGWGLGCALHILAAGMAAVLGHRVLATWRRRPAQWTIAGILASMVAAVVILAIAASTDALGWWSPLLCGITLALAYAWYLGPLLTRAPRPDLSIHNGLIFTTMAAVVGIMLGASQIATAVLLAHHSSRLRVLSVLCLWCGIAMTAAGLLSTTTPSLLPIMLSVRGRWQARRSYRQLRWLWTTLTNEAPEVVLHPTRPVASAYELLWRRIVEIRDAQTRLSTYSHPRVRLWVQAMATQHHLPERQAQLLYEAAELHVGIDAKRQGGAPYQKSPPSCCNEPMHQRGVLAEARWLGEVARTLRRTARNSYRKNSIPLALHTCKGHRGDREHPGS